MEEENGKMGACQISPKIESLNGLGRQATKLYGLVWNFTTFAGLFWAKTLKLGWVAFHSLTFQLKCLDFQSNQYKKLAPVHSIYAKLHHYYGMV